MNTARTDGTSHGTHRRNADPLAHRGVHPVYFDHPLPTRVGRPALARHSHRTGPWTNARTSISGAVAMKEMALVLMALMFAVICFAGAVVLVGI